ncbi:MAG TPA: methyltransferase domain-containing protein [Cyclobacteriaceae bacterium]|nr:methyltransferase domain-containing protein [Cyclobacteriaceae bacterium]
MKQIYTTEITSESITSDNPIHQRLLKAYVIVKNMVQGDLLEVGCGEGRGIDLLLPAIKSYTAIDKIKTAVDKLSEKYPQGRFYSGNIPPLKQFDDNTFDTLISFQVIEHIRQDGEFLKEIHRLLKPGGKAYITTPNRKMSLTRNPWHIREYLPEELTALCQKYFQEVEMKGISGNEKVMQYFEMNRKSVQRITRFDILKLQYRLPAAVLRLPYEILNRMNRNKLQGTDNALVKSIRHDDYLLTDDASDALDLFAILKK